MSDFNSAAAFLSFVNALGHKGLVPDDDAKDLQNKAKYIPSVVTDARRRGKKVDFVRKGRPSQWYWQMPNGEKVPHEV